MKAQEDLVNELQDDDVRWLYKVAPGQQSGNAVRVAVLGPTQVGKTTVILRLLQLTEEGERIVGQILRGKSKQGQSASATATVYGNSTSDRFTYREPQGRTELDLSEEELRRQLRDLRMRVENGRFQSTDAVFIGFPARYFSDQSHPALRIIDLPGLDARSEDERALTRQIIERYLPLCSLALLVERADNLAGLGFLQVPGIGEGWLSFPERHAIVLTRAVSAASVQTAIRARDITTLADLQEFYRKEIFRSLIALDLRAGQPQELEAAINALDIFPLDLGQSRDNLPEEVRTAIEPVLEEAEKALVERVARASEPASALVVTAGLYRAAMSILQKVEESRNKRIEYLEEEKTRIKESRRLIQNQIQRFDEKCKKIEKKRQELIKFLEHIKNKKIKPDPRPKGKEINVKSLNKYIDRHAQRSIEAAHCASKDARTQKLQLAGNLAEQVEIAFEEEVRDIRNLLNKYRVSWYVYDDNADRDSLNVYNSVKRGVKAAGDVIRSAVDVVVNEVTRGFDSDYDKFVKRKTRLQLKDSEEKAAIEKLDYEIEQTEKIFRIRSERISQDIEVGKRFHEHLEKRYLEEYITYLKLLRDPELFDMERFRVMAYLFLIADVYHHLRRSIDMA